MNFRVFNIFSAMSFPVDEVTPVFYAILFDNTEVKIESISEIPRSVPNNDIYVLVKNRLSISEELQLERIKYYKLELKIKDTSFVIYFDIKEGALYYATHLTNKIWKDSAIETIEESIVEDSLSNYDLFPSQGKFIVFYFLNKEFKLLNICNVFKLLEIPGKDELNKDTLNRELYPDRDELFLPDDEIAHYEKVYWKFQKECMKHNIEISFIEKINEILQAFNFLTMFDYHTALYLITSQKLGYKINEFLIYGNKNPTRLVFNDFEDNIFLEKNEHSYTLLEDYLPGHKEMIDEMDNLTLHSKVLEYKLQDFTKWDIKQYAEKVMPLFNKDFKLNENYNLTINKVNFHISESFYAYKQNGWILEVREVNEH